MSPPQKQNANKFEHLLEYLHQSRGFDFTGYKRPSLMRRVTKRMETVNIDDFTEYIDYLEVHPDEFASLFNTILINVTSFFRDPPAWECLMESALPRLLKGPGSPIRVWSAGCSSGEEAYTVAIVLAEALGTKEFQRRVKIYATDADEDALTVARQASYTVKELQAVREELREKYFDKVNGRYIFKPDLRRSVIFGRHDVLQDAPMSRLDLLVCRNTLMYFNAEAQGRLHALSFDTSDSAQIVIDTTGNLMLANQPARQLFSIEPRDIGRPLQDLELSYRPVELRSLIDQAYTENKPVVSENIERH